MPVFKALTEAEYSKRLQEFAYIHCNEKGPHYNASTVMRFLFDAVKDLEARIEEAFKKLEEKQKCTESAKYVD